jgi:SAM-dependent methyltransferase
MLPSLQDAKGRRFTFPNHHFDLVHSQMVATGIHAHRWTQYIRDMFRVVRPGGWCQMIEVYYNVVGRRFRTFSFSFGNALPQAIIEEDAPTPKSLLEHTLNVH